MMKMSKASEQHVRTVPAESPPVQLQFLKATAGAASLREPPDSLRDLLSPPAVHLSHHDVIDVEVQSRGQASVHGHDGRRANAKEWSQVQPVSAVAADGAPRPTDQAAAAHLPH